MSGHDDLLQEQVIRSSCGPGETVPFTCPAQNRGFLSAKFRLALRSPSLSQDTEREREKCSVSEEGVEDLMRTRGREAADHRLSFTPVCEMIVAPATQL